MELKKSLELVTELCSCSGDCPKCACLPTTSSGDKISFCKDEVVDNLKIVSTVLFCLEAPLQKLALSKHRNRSEIYILAETENFKELWHLALCADVLNP